MPRQYAVNGSTTLTSAAKTYALLTSTTAIRPEIYYFAIGCEGAPADNTMVHFWQRYTAAGTNTAVTPSPLDPGDPAATAAGGSNCTVEPTYTSAIILFRQALNQRSHYQWYGDRGPMRLPATGSNGAGLYTSHASATPVFSAVLHYSE